MKKLYVVTVKRTDVRKYNVSAENEDDACDIALDLAENDDSLDYMDCDTVDVERDWRDNYYDEDERVCLGSR